MRSTGRNIKGGSDPFTITPVARPVNTSNKAHKKAMEMGKCMDYARDRNALPKRRDFEKASKNAQEKYARCLHNDRPEGCGGSPLLACKKHRHDILPAEREKDIACWRRCLAGLRCNAGADCKSGICDSASGRCVTAVPTAAEVPYQPGIYPFAHPVASGIHIRKKKLRRKSRRKSPRKSRRKSPRKSRRKSPHRRRRKRIKGVKWEDRLRKSGRFTNKPSYKHHRKHQRKRKKSRKRSSARGRKTRLLRAALGLSESESEQRRRLLLEKERREGRERMDIVANARKVIQTKKRNLKGLERGILLNTTRSLPQLRETTRSRRRHRRHRRRHTRKLREKLKKDIRKEEKHLERMTTNIYTPTDYSPAKEIDAERVVLEVQEAVREEGPEYSANRARVDDLFLHE